MSACLPFCFNYVCFRQSKHKIPNPWPNPSTCIQPLVKPDPWVICMECRVVCRGASLCTSVSQTAHLLGEWHPSREAGPNGTQMALSQPQRPQRAKRSPMDTQREPKVTWQLMEPWFSQRLDQFTLFYVIWSQVVTISCQSIMSYC